MTDLNFYRGKRVFITGHTGFKGSWLCKLLIHLGASITGYALAPPTNPNLFQICGCDHDMQSITGDIRDFANLQRALEQSSPEIVIHMAAQPLVRESYKEPVYTYEVNVMGTVNILECIRHVESVKSFLNITTDKVYRNREWHWGYRENEELNGYDPYSNSKSCSELITDSYRNSFFKKSGPSISTARAGNVIGGGDFAADRIVPDCFRAMQDEKEIIVRNPYSIRPYQHVLEPLIAYLTICMTQYEDSSYTGAYNVGPNEENCLTTGELVTLFCKIWKDVTGNHVSWANRYDGGPHEANFLKLDCSKIKNAMGWHPVWDMDTTLKKTVEWYVEYLQNDNPTMCMESQIRECLCASSAM